MADHDGQHSWVAPVATNPYAAPPPNVPLPANPYAAPPPNVPRPPNPYAPPAAYRYASPPAPPYPPPPFGGAGRLGPLGAPGPLGPVPYAPLPANPPLYPAFAPPGAAPPGRGKHGRRRARKRAPWWPAVALVAVVALLVAGVAVASRSATRDRDVSAAEHTNATPTDRPTARPDTPAPNPDDDAPDDGAPDDTLGAPVPAPVIPSGTAFLTLGGQDGVVITPDDAKTVLMGMWDMRQRAMRARSLSTLRQIEVGAALTADSDALECHCAFFETSLAEDASVVVPQIFSYPAYFFGEVAERSGDAELVDLFVVARADAVSPWRIAFTTGYGGGESEAGHLDASGWAGDAGTPRGADGHEIAALAALWQQTVDTGVVQHGDFIEQSWLVSDRVQELVQYQQDGVQANGLRAHVSFNVDPSAPTFSVQASSGDLACGAIQEKVVFTPARGHAIKQDADQWAFGATLKPGLYRSVTAVSEWEVCMQHWGLEPPLPFGWDVQGLAHVVGSPVPKGQQLSPDPAQVIDPGDGFDSPDGGGSPDGAKA